MEPYHELPQNIFFCSRFPPLSRVEDRLAIPVVFGVDSLEDEISLSPLDLVLQVLDLLAERREPVNLDLLQKDQGVE